jgi:hypothetical protein
MQPKSSQESREQENKSAFDEVIDHYHTVKSAAGGVIKSIDYSKVNEGGNTCNVVIMSPIDFLCDVELAAHKALAHNPSLKKLFTDCYVTCIQEPDTQSPEVDKVRTLVGLAFSQKRIFPVSSYFNPKVIDRSKVNKERKTA